MQAHADTLESAAASSTASVEVIRLGKDEMNLAEFPITLLTDRVPKGKKTIQFEDTVFDKKLGKTITRKLTISADEAHGLPTAVDDDVILGLIQLTKTVNEFRSREVEFSRLDLIRMLGWPDSGDSYRRLTTSLKRWLSVTLLYENAWRDNAKGVWTTKGFHILDNIELNDTRTVHIQGELFPSKIVWNKVVFESFGAGYLKSLDYGLYLSLKHPTSRRMYRFLSKRMYFGPDVTMELADLAFGHVGISEACRNNAGKIEERLQPAIDELVEVGFLEPMTKEDRYQKEGKLWKVRFVAKTKIAPLPDEISQDTGETALVAELVQRGVTKATAVELVQQNPADAIQAKIEVFDWLVERQDRRVDKSPAGYLVTSIQADYAPPKGYVPKAQRQRNQEAKQKAEKDESEKRRREHEETLRKRAEERELDARWQALPAGEQARLDAEILAQADEETLKAYAALKRVTGNGDGYLTVLRRDFLRQQQSEGKFALTSA